MNKTRVERPHEMRAHKARLDMGKIMANQAKPFPGFVMTPAQIASFTPVPFADEMSAVAKAQRDALKDGGV